MEALGGDQLWFDRYAGYHAALVYYWVLVRLCSTAFCVHVTRSSAASSHVLCRHCVPSVILLSTVSHTPHTRALTT